jgi:beta-N-acetylhexosaminidase
MPAATRGIRVAVALVAIVVLAACSGGGGGSAASSETDAQRSEDGPGATTACQPGPVEQRAAAVLIVGMPAVTQSSDPMVAQVLDARVGGILITEPNVRSSEQINQLVSDIKARAGRPIVMATGEESGRVSTFRDVIGRTPSARALAARSAPAVEAFAKDVGSKLAAIGINLDLAPVVDLDAGPAGGLIGDRSFSADPVRAGTYGLAWARGLAAAGVAPTAKHFPGHGRATGDSHLELLQVTTPLAELEAHDVKPFAELIRAGVPAVMLDHVAYTAFDPALPASLAPAAYQLLRRLGFEGVAITDSVGMGAVNLRWNFGEAAVRAVAAGADAVLTTDGTQAPAMRDAIVAAVREGRIPEARLNEAAGRVIALAGGDAKALTCTAPVLPTLG